MGKQKQTNETGEGLKRRLPEPKIDEKLLDRVLSGKIGIEPVQVDLTKGTISEKVSERMKTVVRDSLPKGEGVVVVRAFDLTTGESVETAGGEQPEAKTTKMQFGREEDFVGFMQEVAAKASGSPLYDDSLAEELGKFLKSHFDRAREAHTPPVPERRYIPRKDEIVPFLREVWSEWLTAEQLTMPILKDADYRAYQALHNWTRKNNLPADVRIKTSSETTDEFLARDYFRRDEIFRAASALSRRGIKNI
ncbi:hypothetical protein GCM10011349_23660 [Novosphingobium indicum]|uniref:Tail assembly chaperone n=1 Tax=Novosphingobium indicum TaxID=462949 RepID=A0ABQ2JMF2_9SPHN|nr:hypothetical protein [Novosphingobium indicum]GGN51250.1 hypothetical protein GCM10011349_23660 [Novosphingobium indicum]